MLESKFSLQPLTIVRKYKEPKEKKLSVTLDTRGQIRFSPSATEKLGFTNERGECLQGWLKFYFDPKRRVLAFKPLSSLMAGRKRDTSIRLLKSRKSKNMTKPFLVVNIKTFVHSITDGKFPCRVKMERYTDSIFGEVWYVQVPSKYKYSTTDGTMGGDNSG